MCPPTHIYIHVSVQIFIDLTRKELEEVEGEPLDVHVVPERSATPSPVDDNNTHDLQPMINEEEVPVFSDDDDNNECPKVQVEGMLINYTVSTCNFPIGGKFYCASSQI